MRIDFSNKNDLLGRLEAFARKLNESANQVVIQNPVAFADQIKQKGSELLAILQSSIFKPRARFEKPEYYRAQVKKRVLDNLEETLQDPEMIENITDSLIQAAKVDPYYRKLLGLEEHWV